MDHVEDYMYSFQISLGVIFFVNIIVAKHGALDTRNLWCIYTNSDFRVAPCCTMPWDPIRTEPNCVSRDVAWRRTTWSNAKITVCVCNWPCAFGSWSRSSGTFRSAGRASSSRQSVTSDDREVCRESGNLKINFFFSFEPRSQSGWPDWANLRLLGDFLLWVVSRENYCSVKNNSATFPW
jgi:hypothetical protein